MPLYEYDCPACGQVFEKLVRMSQADEVACPHCGNAHSKRHLSRIAIQGQTQPGAASSPLPASGGT